MAKKAGLDLRPSTCQISSVPFPLLPYNGLEPIPGGVGRRVERVEQVRLKLLGAIGIVLETAGRPLIEMSMSGKLEYSPEQEATMEIAENITLHSRHLTTNGLALVRNHRDTVLPLKQQHTQGKMW